MNYNYLISNIQWIPVILLTILSFVLGFIWHQPFLFGNIWKKENFGNNFPKFNAAKIFGFTAVMHFLALSALSAVLSHTGAMNGLINGLLICAIWVLPAMGGTYLFANRSMKLLLIDAGMYIVLFGFSGLLLGIF